MVSFPTEEDLLSFLSSPERPNLQEVGHSGRNKKQNSEYRLAQSQGLRDMRLLAGCGTHGIIRLLL